MGHIRLGVLPKYPRWKDVISLLDNTEAPASQVADKVLDASREALDSQSAQSSVGYCVWLLAQLVLASRGEDLIPALEDLGIQADERTSAAEFLARTSHVASRHLGELMPHTALNNIAELSLREALTRTIGMHATTLFGAALPEIRLALRRYSTRVQFASLLHTFFTAFLSRTLGFVIDKEIADHVGPGRRFENLHDVEEFEGALEQFASQTSRIVDTFSGGWYSKRTWYQGDVSESDADGFVRIALTKLRADLGFSLNEVS